MLDLDSKVGFNASRDSAEAGDATTLGFTTTTWAALHPEIETRMLSLTIRDDKAQTQAIIRSLAKRAIVSWLWKR